jgi:hypothetical protein
MIPRCAAPFKNQAAIHINFTNTQSVHLSAVDLCALHLGLDPAELCQPADK